MIENVTFTLPSGLVLMPEDYGMILKSFDAPAPRPKLNMISIPGMNGDLDLTAWAGETRFENRTVSIELRDMEGENYATFISLLHGQQCKILHSVEPSFVYSGRCSEADIETRNHITDLKMTFTCFPYRLSAYKTNISKTVTGGLSIPLKAKCMSAVPQITLTAACSVTFDYVTKSLAAGTHTVPEFIITKNTKEMAVSGSGTITIEWTEGVI